MHNYFNIRKIPSLNKKNKYACIYTAINMHRLTLKMHKMVLLQMVSHRFGPKPQFALFDLDRTSLYPTRNEQPCCGGERVAKVLKKKDRTNINCMISKDKVFEHKQLIVHAL